MLHAVFTALSITGVLVMLFTSNNEPVKQTVVIKNIGTLLTGDIENPISDADTVLVKDGRIVAVGKEKEVDLDGADFVIDCNGTTLAPGLIDSHVHPVAGDFTPRQNQIGWIDSCLNGGVTTMISAGELHYPGRPTDIEGVKALAITSQRGFKNFRPSGVKVHAGAPIVEKGMVEDDFRDMARAGVTMIGEIGLGSVKAGYEARQMVEWCRKYGIQTTIHTGGESIPGSGLIDKDVVLEADADVIGHINGGHTSLPYKQVCELCERSDKAMEIVHNGNERIAILTARHAHELRCMHRVILGTDAPTGSGAQPLGILRTISLLASLADIPPEVVFCFATGNTARVRELDCGLIEPGRVADFVFMDRPMNGEGQTLLESVRLGDLPGISMVMIDGSIKCLRSRLTPPAAIMPTIVKQPVQTIELV